MGLNTSFGAWDGAYSSFHTWRRIIAKKAGLNLDEMLGFGGEKEFDSNHNLTPLLNHSDCDGELTVAECKKVKAGLEEILKDMPKVDMRKHQATFQTDDEWAAYKAKLFVKGCEEAIKKKKPIDFH